MFNSYVWPGQCVQVECPIRSSLEIDSIDGSLQMSMSDSEM